MVGRDPVVRGNAGQQSQGHRQGRAQQTGGVWSLCSGFCSVQGNRGARKPPPTQSP